MHSASYVDHSTANYTQVIQRSITIVWRQVDFYLHGMPVASGFRSRFSELEKIVFRVQEKENQDPWDSITTLQWASEQMIKFWWHCGSQIRIRMVTLVRRALAEACTRE